MRAAAPRRRWAAAAHGLCAVLLLALSACATREPQPQAAEPATAAAPAAVAEAAPVQAAPPHPQAKGRVLARGERQLVYLPAAGDTHAGMAERLLGSAELAWVLSDASGRAEPVPGVPVALPLQPPNALGVGPDGVQTVPILCYHRLGAGSSKMVVAPAQFEAQMTWLVRNGYRVVRLADLEAFLAGTRALPQRSVVVTFDDGYESVYRHAWPVLRRLGLPATVFVYTDFLGGGDALTWPQLQEMHASGLVDIQSHSKSHRNLIERRPGENDERYRAAIEAELRVPRETLERRLTGARVRHLAYPFGDTNDVVLDTAARQAVTLAATVVPGGNAFYAPPLLLRRTMIFGDMTLDAFRARLQVTRPLSNP